MKKTVKSFALFLALCAAAGAVAQTGEAVPASAADTVLLSERTDGNYLVRRFVVRSHDDSDYSILYQINSYRLSTALDDNSKQLDELNAFVGSLMTDTLLRVRKVEITGYASPDGPQKFNQTLARNRASDFKAYVDKKYDFSDRFDVESTSVVEDWAAARSAVASSDIPGKQSVLDILDGDKWSQAQKEQALRKLPSAWNYLRKNILPPMRRVEMVVWYNGGYFVETRTMLAEPAPVLVPVPAPKSEPCCVVIDQTSGLIVEMDEPGIDFEPVGRRDLREMDQASKSETRAARKEARIARKLAKREARAAEEMIEQAEKAARKMAKAEARAAKQSSKELEKVSE